MTQRNLEGVCENPVKFESRRISDKMPAEDVEGAVFAQYDTIRGFNCLNADQPNGKRCDDYEVRTCCPKQGMIDLYNILRGRNFSFLL